MFWLTCSDSAAVLSQSNRKDDVILLMLNESQTRLLGRHDREARYAKEAVVGWFITRKEKVLVDTEV